ncbi:MAG: hypothetical protein AAGJ87_10740, partial [Pseudomonadota bacterium]
MRQLLSGSRQMIAVAIGWQVYDLARETLSIEESAFLLGLVGLIQFAPVLLLSLVGGQAADRLDRKLILMVANAAKFLIALGLIAAAFAPREAALAALRPLMADRAVLKIGQNLKYDIKVFARYGVAVDPID